VVSKSIYEYYTINLSYRIYLTIMCLTHWECSCA